MLSTGCRLRNRTRAVTAQTRTANHTGADREAAAGGGPASPVKSTADTARVIVSQFSQAKLPDSTSHSCVAMTAPAAYEATGCGVNSRTGTTSCVTWLAAHSTRCRGGGRWWKNQLSGPAIGCVSWWKYRQVSFRQQGSPRILISPAPNSTRKSTHRSSHSTSTGGPVRALPRNTARKPTSSSSDSQPKEYQVWPTFTMER